MSKQTGRGFAVRAASTGPITFLAATSNLARDGLIIEPIAWDLGPFRANPVVLWAHDYLGQRPPIGRATDVRIEAAGLVADLEFDQDDDFARSVERKIRNGYLNTVSVGWDTKLQSGNRVKRAELLDISVVPVPGDPGAVAIARSAYGRRSGSDLSQRYDATQLDRGVLVKLRDALTPKTNRTLERWQREAREDEDRRSIERITEQMSEAQLRALKADLDRIARGPGSATDKLVKGRVALFMRSPQAERIIERRAGAVR